MQIGNVVSTLEDIIMNKYIIMIAVALLIGKAYAKPTLEKLDDVCIPSGIIGISMCPPKLDNEQYIPKQEALTSNEKSIGEGITMGYLVGFYVGCYTHGANSPWRNTPKQIHDSCFATAKTTDSYKSAPGHIQEMFEQSVRKINNAREVK